MDNLKEGSFIIFPNSYKEKPMQPDFTGKAVVNGEQKQIAVWKKKTKSGELMLAGNIKDADDKGKKSTTGFVKKPETTDVDPFDV